MTYSVRTSEKFAGVFLILLLLSSRTQQQGQSVITLRYRIFVSFLFVMRRQKLALSKGMSLSHNLLVLNVKSYHCRISLTSELQTNCPMSFTIGLFPNPAFVGSESQMQVIRFVCQVTFPDELCHQHPQDLTLSNTIRIFALGMSLLKNKQSKTPKKVPCAVCP